ncbi:Copper-translocating P-type ATPase, partial [human gut metagenome]
MATFIPGHGIEVKIDDKEVLLGNRKLMDDKKIKSENVSNNSDLFEQGNNLAEQGKTPMYIAINNNLVGIIAVADIVKPSSKKAIESL